MALFGRIVCRGELPL